MMTIRLQSLTLFLCQNLQGLMPEGLSSAYAYDYGYSVTSESLSQLPHLYDMYLKWLDFQTEHISKTTWLDKLTKKNAIEFWGQGWTIAQTAVMATKDEQYEWGLTVCTVYIFWELAKVQKTTG